MAMFHDIISFYIGVVKGFVNIICVYVCMCGIICVYFTYNESNCVFSQTKRTILQYLNP